MGDLSLFLHYFCTLGIGRPLAVDRLSSIIFRAISERRPVAFLHHVL
jgi:hypothetical protein